MAGKKSNTIFNKKPSLDGKKSLGYLLIYLGYLLFLIAVRALVINTSGSTQSLMQTTFTVFLSIYVGLVVAGGAGLVIQFLRYLTWLITTPEWKRKQEKGRLNRR